MKITTARTTGLLYLGLAATGIVAFLFARNNIFVEGDAVATAANLVQQESLARLGIATEVGVAGFQALVALWFFKLFRKKDSFAAGLLAAFGLVNAIIILASSAMWLTALNNALGGGPAETSQILFNIHDNLWLVAKLFFGLWLLPMAYLAKLSRMPRPLVWFLTLGGIGYVLSAFTSVLLPGQTALSDALPIFATVGEFWIVGYLLIKPVKP
jgi:hypothetical protein